MRYLSHGYPRILTQCEIIRGERFGKAHVNYGPQRSVVHEQNFEEN